ncbi:hypothetical protein FisN_6Lh006 [Fistulifera solaris]|uniref:Uncharacterized protein n=1 Tax=Fistulifera solaris TaxID=1519565 RepID=A0A1Z5KPE6_FISSO|nr:hypothetical protein FisN_6Lh006 [Fistulifera solaris]|eukprot:GAX28166.1 hypothetical protein FisN_6Lh006 [Fistulifera solaris]
MNCRLLCLFVSAFLKESFLVLASLPNHEVKSDLDEPTHANLSPHSSSLLRKHRFELESVGIAPFDRLSTIVHSFGRRLQHNANSSDDKSDDSDSNNVLYRDSDSADDETIVINHTDVVLEIEMNISNCNHGSMVIETDRSGCEITGVGNNINFSGCERAFLKIVLNATGCESGYAMIETHNNDTDSADDIAHDSTDDQN